MKELIFHCNNFQVFNPNIVFLLLLLLLIIFEFFIYNYILIYLFLSLFLSLPLSLPFISLGIHVSAYSPLGSPSYIELNMDGGEGQGLLLHPTLVKIAGMKCTFKLSYLSVFQEQSYLFILIYFNRRIFSINFFWPFC